MKRSKTSALFLIARSNLKELETRFSDPCDDGIFHISVENPFYRTPHEEVRIS